MRKMIVLGSIILTFLLIACESRQSADTIYVTANIYTMDETFGTVEAMAVKNGRVVAVGSSESLMNSWRGRSTQVINLQGRTVIPGITEAHAHFKGVGQLKQILDLSSTKNWLEVVRLVKAAADKSPPGRWIEGRGWHQEKWDKIAQPVVEGYPVNTLLNEVSPNNPVYLRHASGHAVMVNHLALNLAGISSESENPEGGRILRFGDGKPTGVLLENAIEAVAEKKEESETGEKYFDRLKEAYRLAQQECFSYGITSFHDAGSTFKELDILNEMYETGELAIRLWVMLSEEDQIIRRNFSKYKWKNAFDDHLTVGGIKRYMDGALGSRGAWLVEPYSDLRSSKGLNTIRPEDLRRTAQLAYELNLQLCTHAIGDRANHEVLNIYEEIFKKHPEKKDWRWRIEHAQLLLPEDISRFGKLHIIAAMQTVHCTSDGPWVVQRIGENRARTGAYVWRKILDSGGIIINGTDSPVESVNPFQNFYAAVTRKMANGKIFYGDQKMSRFEALKSMTVLPAYAEFNESRLGTLSPGKWADFVVLSHDILTVPEEQIRNIQVLQTVINGKTVYQYEKERM